MSGEEVDIDSLGIKALKEFITEAGLSTADCIDKNDLRARAREAAAAKASAPPVSSSSAESASSSSRKTMKIGVYECIVQGPPELINGGGGPPADVLILGLHGLGASNTDLVDLPKILGQLEPSIGSARRVEVYPQAPMTSVGSAWWQLDLMGFMQVLMMPQGPAREAGIAKLIRTKFPGVDECRAQMKAVLAEARKLAGGSDGPLPFSRVVIGGFSLGSITSLDVALQLDAGETVAGVLVMNGAPICVDEWAERIKLHRGLKVFISGGMNDMTMPGEASGWAKQLLDSFGAVTELQMHAGGHEIGGPDQMRKIAGWMAKVLPPKKE